MCSNVLTFRVWGIGRLGFRVVPNYSETENYQTRDPNLEPQDLNCPLAKSHELSVTLSVGRLNPMPQP